MCIEVKNPFNELVLIKVKRANVAETYITLFVVTFLLTKVY
jgi:hypothetical protein